MIELPEAIVLSEQLNEVLENKKISEVIVNQSPHKFAWYSGDADYYCEVLLDKQFTGAKPVASFVKLEFGDSIVVYSEGIKLLFLQSGEKRPKKHQLLIEFDDGSALSGSVQMYGGLLCGIKDIDNEYYQNALSKPTPYSDEFTYEYFCTVCQHETLMNKSVKEVLATKQRIPGLGNGVLQDILYNSKLHPKRKMNTMSEQDIKRLYHGVISTLTEMVGKGGRDTEKDLFGCTGNYKTKVSKYTVGKPCAICGSVIVKKAYMGGSVYYCEQCQPV